MGADNMSMRKVSSLSSLSTLQAVLLTLVMSVMLFAGTSVQAAPAPHIKDEVGAARLAGEGTFRWYGFSVYDAALWVGERGYSSAKPDVAPFVLDLRYARALEGQKIAEASVEEIEKLGLGTGPQRAVWLAKMSAIFPDVKEGSHLSGAYLPGVGVRFYLDGKALAEVADPAFAHAFFAIWLDPATSAKSLRTALLLNAAPSP
jgi:hypothetical protein